MQLFLKKKIFLVKSQIERGERRKNPLGIKREMLYKREERSHQVNKIQISNQTNLTRKIQQLKKPRGKYASRLNLNDLIQFFKD